MTAAVLLLLVTVAAVSAEPLVGYSVCELNVCRCDTFRRISCACTEEHHEVTIRSGDRYKLLPETTELIVSNCTRVFVHSNAIKRLRELRLVRFASIKDLVLSAESLAWSPYDDSTVGDYRGVAVEFIDARLRTLPSYAIKGRIGSLTLQRCDLGEIEPFAVSTVHGTMTSLHLVDSAMGVVHTQAFKKFDVDTLVIRNCTLADPPSRTLSDLRVNKVFAFEGNTVRTLRSGFVIADGPRAVHIENNTIATMESDAFRMTVEGPVTIRANRIGEIEPKSFAGIKVTRGIAERDGRQEFKFLDNTVAILRPDSLLTDSDGFTMIIKRLNVDAACSCTTDETLHYAPIDDEVFCRGDNHSFRSLTEYKKSACGSGDTLSATLITTIVVFGVFIIAAVVIAAFLLIRRFVCGEHSIFYPARKTAEETNVVRPEGRTYKETELYVIVEKAELLTTDL